MKMYWRGTNIRVSKFKLFLVGLLIPKEVWCSWESESDTLKQFIKYFPPRSNQRITGLDKEVV